MAALARAVALMLALAGAALVAAPAGAAVSSVPDQAVQTNGSVTSIARSADRVFVGGAFSRAGIPTGGGADLSQSTGAVNHAFAAPNDGVRAVASDGAGGWYVGGQFTAVGGVARNRLAHLLSDGSVDPSFDPDLDGDVWSLLVSGTTLYVGGGFSTVGGVSRPKVAAIDRTTGQLSSFDAGITSAPGRIRGLALSGSRLYLAGDFQKLVGSEEHNHLIAVDATTGALVPGFDPTLGGSATTLAVSGGKVYVGLFSSVDGVTRLGVAAINEADGSLDMAFNPGFDGFVQTIVIGAGKIYVGGRFAHVGAFTRNQLVALDLGGAVDPAFDPNVLGAVPSNTVVTGLALSGSTLFVAGLFDTVNGGVRRNHLAAFDAATGAVTPFDVDADNFAYAIAAAGARVYAGGFFTWAGKDSIHNRLAAMRLDGTPDASFDPDFNGDVNTLLASGSTLYAGGTFTTVSGAARNRLAALDAATGAVDPAFNPNMSNNVSALVRSGPRLYAGGSFTTVNGGAVARNRLAALDASTGAADATFNPNMSAAVGALALAGSKLYAGGAFNAVNGTTPATTRNRLAALDATTGLADPTFDPNMNSTVSALVLSGSRLYAGGSFTTVAGGALARNRLAAVDTTTGAADPAFDPNMSGAVGALALSGARLYAGGAFTTVNGDGVSRNRLAALDAATGAADAAFDPNMSSTVSALLASGPVLYAGGAFTTVGGASRLRFAQFTERAVAPSAVSGAASAITDTGATLAGTVTSNAAPATYTFEFGTSLAFGSITPAQAAAPGETPTAVSTALSGLSPSTTYYYRVVASSSAGTSFGVVRSFRTTGVAQAPAVITGAASSVANTSASVAGQVDPNGQQTAFTVEYGTSASFGSIAPVVALDDGDALEAVSASLTGLSPDTTYLFRVVATNATGTTFGSVGSFDTGPGGAPIVSTGAATAITATGATLSATVDAHGSATAFAFEYGPTTAFGSLSAIDGLAATNGAHGVSLSLSGLSPGTTYRYRVVATNASGTSSGTVHIFTTAASA